MNKIMKMSRFLKFMTLAIIVFLPMYNIGYWLTDGYSFFPLEILLYPKFEQIPTVATLQVWQKFVGFFVVMIPMGIIIVALCYAYKLFDLFAKLQIFTATAIQLLRKIALAILVSLIVHPFYTALISVLLTIKNAPGQRIISISVGIDQLILIGVTCLLYLIFWIMDEGRKLHEEVEGTI